MGGPRSWNQAQKHCIRTRRAGWAGPPQVPWARGQRPLQTQILDSVTEKGAVSMGVRSLHVLKSHLMVLIC